MSVRKRSSRHNETSGKNRTDALLRKAREGPVKAPLSAQVNYPDDPSTPKTLLSTYISIFEADVPEQFINEHFSFQLGQIEDLVQKFGLDFYQACRCGLEAI